MSTICTTPAKADTGGGNRTLNGLVALDDLSAARLPFRHPSPKTRLRVRESNPHFLFQRQASLPLDHPGTPTTNPARLERAASTSARLRSHPSELRVQWRKVWESNPQELSLRQFSGLLGVPVPNLPRGCIREDSNLHALGRATALQTAADPVRRLMQKMMKAGATGTPQERPRLHSSRDTSVVKQQKERARWLPTGSRPAPNRVSTV